VNKAGTKVLWGSNWREDMNLVEGVDTYLCEFSISGDVPVTRTVQNVDIPDGQTHCYNASQTITVAGAGSYFSVQDGGNTTFIAGQNIRFQPGTTAHSGGHLWGYIATSGPYCTTPSIPALVSGFDEPSAEKCLPGMKVYPNPATGKFIIELTGEPYEKAIGMEVYGPWGDHVLTTLGNGQGKLECSLSGKPAGLYFIRVSAGNKSQTAKIILL